MERFRLNRLFVVVLLLINAVTFAAWANDYVYTAGSVDMFGVNDPRRNLNWQNQYNWEPEGIPGAGDGATVSAGRQVFLVSSVTVKNLTVIGNDTYVRGANRDQNLTVTGICNWSAGVIGFGDLGNFNITSGATLNLLSDARKFLGALALNNAGTFNWVDTGYLVTYETVNNSGTMNITTPTGYFGNTGNGGIFNNSGTVIRSAGSGLFSFSGFDGGGYYLMAFNNSGSLQVQSGTVQIQHGRSTGTFNVSSGAVLQFAGGHEFDAGTFSGAGAQRFITFGGNSTTNYARGNITINGTLEMNGGSWHGGFSSVPGSNASMGGTGKLSWQSGSLLGIWTITPGFHIEASGGGGKGISTTQLINRGIIDWLGGGAFAASSNFINEGTFNSKAAGTFWAGVVSTPPDFENRGTLNTFTGANAVDFATITNAGTLNIGSNGAGTLTGLRGLGNSGTINLGAGDYLETPSFGATATSKINVDIGGTTAAQYGKTYVGNNPAFAGSLNARYVNGFVPQEGDAFRVITKGSQVSAFDKINAPVINNRTLIAQYDTNFLDLVAKTVSLSINDVTITESNGGSAQAAFTVTLSTPYTQTVTVVAQSGAGGSPAATAGADYNTLAPITITFNPGQVTKTVSVTVLGDTLDESDEKFAVSLSSAVNAAISDNTGVGTIIDNDDPPLVSVNAPNVTEGNSGTAAMAFTIKLSAASARNVSVQYQTAVASTFPATAGADFTAVPLTTVIFTAGQTNKTVDVTVKGDTLDEDNERVRLNLTNPVNATLGTIGEGIIVDDDATPSLNINDVQVLEGNSGTKLMLFTVTLSAASGRTVTVNAATGNGGTPAATVGTDYVALASTPLTFTPGQTSKQVAVTINGDTIVEVNEKFAVIISGAVNASISDNSGIGTMLNDDAPGAPASVNEPSGD